MLRRELIIVVLIFVAALFPRTSYKLDSPLIEAHSWRQADTAAVARNFAREGFDLLRPTYDDVSHLQSGRDNPKGYRMVEFPWYNATIAAAYSVMPSVSIVVWGRVISALCAAITAVCIYLLVLQENKRLAAVVGSLTFAWMPFIVFYTRAILPENPALAATFAALTIASYARNKVWLLLSAALFSLATLAKPTTLFFALPFFYILNGFTTALTRKTVLSCIAIAGSLVPLFAWRLHIQQYPEGIPASLLLITSVNAAGQQVPVLFRPFFFRWIFYERLTLAILGVFGLVPFLLGFFAKTKTLLLQFIGLASLIYVFVFQGGNVQHEYYQILLFPAIAIFVGLGVEYIHTKVPRLWNFAATGLIITFIAAGGWITWQRTVRHLYYSLSDIPKFARIVQTFVNEDEWIVVDTGGDTTTLFAFDRKGAPAIFDTSVNMRAKGYRYIFTYNKNAVADIMKNDPNVKIIFENNKFTLMKL
jgi:MFS family permease